MLVQLRDVPEELGLLGGALVASGHEVVTQTSAPDVLVLGLPRGGTDDTDDATSFLDHTYGIYEQLVSTNAQVVVLLSSTRVYDGLDRGWRVTGDFAPQPTPELASLGPHLAEMTARELAREGRLRVWVLRLDTLGDVAAGAFLDPRDGAEAIVTAVNQIGALRGAAPSALSSSYRELIVSGDTVRFGKERGLRSPFEWEPTYPSQSTRAERRRAVWPCDADPVHVPGSPSQITVYGAGGPMGVAVCGALQGLPGVVVTATDRSPLAELAARPPQSAGAPLPVTMIEPHLERTVDVTDYAQVLDAARGADCLVNTSVVRDDPRVAFLVNALGTWNITRAAVELGIDRVVQTGPTLTLLGDPGGFAYDRDVPADAPVRPARWVYGLSKMLGLEASRVLAESARIAVPQLLFNQLLPNLYDGRPLLSFAASWRDSGRAVAAATQVTDWPEPSPRLDVLVPNPHRRTQYRRTWKMLGIEPLDRMDEHWMVEPDQTDETAPPGPRPIVGAMDRPEPKQ